MRALCATIGAGLLLAAPVQAESPAPTGEAARTLAVSTAGADPLARAALVLCEANPDRGAIARQPDIADGRIADNLWFAGTKAVSSWIWRRGREAVVIDAMDDPREAQDNVLATLDRAGIDRRDVRLLVVTHGHRDHSGGVRTLLAQLPNARLAITPEAARIASEAAAKAGEFFPQPGIPLRDGMLLAGAIRVVATPGHSPGTVSLILPVLAGSQHLVAALMGGSSSYALSREDLATYAASVRKLAAAAARAQVDLVLSNHPVLDDTRAWAAAGGLPRQGAALPPEAVARYYRVVELCARAHLR